MRVCPLVFFGGGEETVSEVLRGRRYEVPRYYSVRKYRGRLEINLRVELTLNSRTEWYTVPYYWD